MSIKGNGQNLCLNSVLFLFCREVIKNGELQFGGREKEHQPCWKEWYTDEENFLKNRVPKIERISHIGSTAIGSICAKPIIDILMEI